MFNFWVGDGDQTGPRFIKGGAPRPIFSAIPMRGQPDTTISLAYVSIDISRPRIDAKL
jgi:hypothetical protein